MRFTRAGRVILSAASLVVALAAAACSGPPSPAAPRLEKASIVVGALPIVDTAGLYLAQQEGYFQQAGLNVTIVPIEASPQAIPGLESGKVDIVAGANYVSFFQAQATGGQFKLLVDGTACSPDSFQVLVAAGSGILTPVGLAGKRIAVNVLSNIQTLLINATLQADGVNSATVHYVQVPFPGMARALTRHRVDAISAVEPFITSAELGISASPVMSTCTGSTASFPMSGYFSTQKWAQTYPATARAFQAAMARGQALANTSRVAVEGILPTYIKNLTPTEAAVVNLGQFPTSVNATHLGRVVSLMVSGGLLSPQFSVQPLLFH